MSVKEVGEGGGGGVGVEGHARRCRGGVCVGDECVYARGRRGNVWVCKGGGGGVGVRRVTLTLPITMTPTVHAGKPPHVLMVRIPWGKHAVA